MLYFGKENNSHKISGTAITFTNFVIMMGDFIFQSVVGNILDWLWDGRLENGICIYIADNYTYANRVLYQELLHFLLKRLVIKSTSKN